MRSRISRLLSVFAIAIGVALVAVTSAFKEQPKAKNDDTTYYFQFNGSDGQEDQPAQWSQIDETTYDLSSCHQIYRGCMLATTAVTGSDSSLHPAQIDVDVDPTNSNNKSPKLGNGVSDVKNRVASY